MTMALLVCSLLCVLMTDKAVCLWLAGCQAANRGRSLHIWMKGKRIWKTIFGVIFLYFQRKSKDYHSSHTQRFCKYIQKQSEWKHWSVKEALGEPVFIHEVGIVIPKDLGPWRIWVIDHQSHLNFLGYNDYIYWIIYQLLTLCSLKQSE